MKADCGSKILLCRGRFYGPGVCEVPSADVKMRLETASGRQYQDHAQVGLVLVTANSEISGQGSPEDSPSASADAPSAGGTQVLPHDSADGPLEIPEGLAQTSGNE